MWEEKRLATLRATRILDTPAEDTFDALTRLAALYCETPFSFVTLVDENRLWFKSKYGSDLAEMPRDSALCGHTAEQGHPLIVHDINDDPRFAENRLYREAGLRFYAGHPLFSRDGVCLGTLCVLDLTPRDIREDQMEALRMLAAQGSALIELHRARVEAKDEAAREHDERLRLVLDSIPDGVVLLLDGKVVYQNPAALSITGREAAEIQSKNPFVFLHPDDREKARNRTAEIQSGGPEYPSEYRVLLPDGGITTLEVRSRCIRYDGKPAILAILQDLTERRRVDAERRDMEQKLQQAQKLESLGILAGGIAHDFNNLLTSVLGNLALARHGLPEHAPCAPRIDNIEKAALRAADLCRQMLAYSGRGKFVLRPVNLSDVVREMGELLSVSISKKAALRYELEPDIPPVHADASQVGQIVMNLITNASEALEGRDGTIDVRTGHAFFRREELESDWISSGIASGEYAFVEVRDSGCGMTGDTQRRLFDPFYTTKFTGRGLGMAAVLGIVRGHRGAIRVDSEPGMGTAITVLFPRSETTAVPLGESVPATDAISNTGGTVLVVDDEEIVRDLAREILESAGYVVHALTDGAAAVAWMETSGIPIDAALLDLTMPRLGGEETCRALRRIDPELPVILSSGFNEQELRDPGQLDGPVTFLHKPYAPAELLRLVGTAVARRGPDLRAVA